MRWNGRRSEPAHPTLAPETVRVHGDDCLVTFTYLLRTYCAYVHLPDGTTVQGPVKTTKADAKDAAWRKAHGLRLIPPPAA